MSNINKVFNAFMKAQAIYGRCENAQREMLAPNGQPICKQAYLEAKEASALAKELKEELRQLHAQLVEAGQ